MTWQPTACRSLATGYRSLFTDYRSLGQEPTHQRFPFFFEPAARSLLAGTGIPVIRIGKIAFLAVEISVHTRSGLAGFFLDDLVGALPIIAGIVPQCT